MLTYDNFINSLLSSIPTFKPVYDEHIRFYGELLDHVLFGELFDFTVQAYERGDVEQIKQVIVFINEVVKSEDERLLNVVHVSFLEDVPHSLLADVVPPLLNEAA